jgi:hypothetical protein
VRSFFKTGQNGPGQEGHPRTYELVYCLAVQTILDLDSRN